MDKTMENLESDLSTAAEKAVTSKKSAMCELGSINFEDLIKSNVTPKNSMKEDGESNNESIEEQPKAKQSPPNQTDSSQKSATNLPKLAPKTNALAALKAANPGQVVIIQSPSGNPLPIRLSGNATNTSGKPGVPVTIQVLKMPDGSFVHLKTNKSLNLTNLSNVVPMTLASKKIAAGTSNSVVVKSTTQAANGATTKQPSPAANNIGAQLLKSISTTDAQKMGILKGKSNDSNAKPVARILASSIINTSTSTTISSSSNSSQQSATQKQTNATPKLIIQDKDVKVKSEGAEGGAATKQIQLVKLSPNSSSPIQAIQIPGKPGLQYVRVLGTTGSKGSPLTAIRAKDSHSSKMSLIPQIIGNSKIIMTSSKISQRPSTNSSAATASKEGSSSSQGGEKQNVKTVITTVPTLRKISETPRTAVTMVKKEESPPLFRRSNDTNSKISNLNQQIKKITSLGVNANSNKQNMQLQKAKSQFHLMSQQLRQMKPEKSQPQPSTSASIVTETSNTKKLYSVLKPSSDTMEENPNPARKRSPSPEEGVRRKHCNCTKSQCLKLYCDCFANGEFCQNCNCKECYNNLEYEDERQKAIKNCLERNPNAFKPKITKARDQSDLRLHNKGCNCKRSGCLKNYCECYEAKIACSANCKCLGCRNVEDRSEMDPLEVAKIAQNFGRGVTTKRRYDEISDKPSTSSSGGSGPQTKQPYNFITQDVVDATIQCMIAQADECKKTGFNTKTTEKMILEELGRCLVEIIDFSIRNMSN